MSCELPEAPTRAGSGVAPRSARSGRVAGPGDRWHSGSLPMELLVFKIAVLSETSFAPPTCLPSLFLETRARLWGAIGSARRCRPDRTGESVLRWSRHLWSSPGPPGSRDGTAKAAGIEAEKTFDRPSSSRRFGRVGPTTPTRARRLVDASVDQTEASSGVASGPMSAGSAFMLLHLVRC
jgi:hypothetical protein